MQMRLTVVVLGLGGLLAVARRTTADDAPEPDLKPLFEEVRKLVEKHYRKAEITLKDQTIHFEFNTRKFMVHEPLLTGEWQVAHEEPGPQKGGIYGAIKLRAGQYGGMAVAPKRSTSATSPTCCWLRMPRSSTTTCTSI
jgi:hypothetical protein